LTVDHRANLSGQLFADFESDPNANTLEACHGDSFDAAEVRLDLCLKGIAARPTAADPTRTEAEEFG